jgi:WhiB family transcriptional regulator, redox-sensing transcriptional regulator
MAAPAWYNHAACADQPTELFYGPPDETSRAKQTRERAAKAVCRRCPARRDCLNQAISSEADTGVWGGKNGKERAHERRRRRDKQRRRKAA